MTVLEGRGLTVRFGMLTALRDVSIQLCDGEILGLIGPNGAGKTTLVNVLSGVERATAGSVVLNGRDVTAASLERRARLGLARSFQGAKLFPRLTVLENVEVPLVTLKRLGRRKARARATELISAAGLTSQLHTPARQLPYGASRRLSVTRAAAGDPCVLMLDEPAAGLNEEEADSLLETILGIRAELGCATLVIEHDMRFVMGLCDRLQVLNFGEVLRVGPVAEVRHDPAVIAAYLGDQGTPAGASLPSGSSIDPVVQSARQVGHSVAVAPHALVERRLDRRVQTTDDDDIVLSVEGLAVHYRDIVAVRDLDLQVRRGEIVGMIGANGAGKSSTLNAIAGLVTPRRGSIRFEGRELTAIAPEQIVRQGLALVPERRRIFSHLTVGENLDLTRACAGRTEAFRVNRERILERFPVLGDRLHDRAGLLSGGEQQQLAIARALLCRPRLLLLDEPSLGLAPLIIRDVFELLAELRGEGLTLLVVEQSVAQILSVADDVYVVENGGVVAHGKAEDLADQISMTQAYLGR